MFNAGIKIKGFLNKKVLKGFLTIVAAAVFFGYAGSAAANNIRWYISPSDPYVQNWSDTTAINIDDNWDNFIAINGYRGDDLTTGIGVDPQTILADGEATPLDVIANQSNPNTLTTGGVAEFDGIANPTIALKGSGTADAPHLVIQLNRASCPDAKFFTISYKVRDLDSTANNAASQVALHYRVGTTGNYINVPGAFVADATDPNAATKVSNVIGNLPHIPAGVNEIYMRIMTANAAGNDEWVGIDDINIGCFAPTSASAEITGRVLTGKAGGVSRATVFMTDQEGLTYQTRTNTFGYYKFDNMPTGRFYTFSVLAKGLQFAPRVVALSDSISELDFYAQE